MSGYLVLWKQPMSSGTGYAMYPVTSSPEQGLASILKDGVWYSPNISRRKVFATAVEAEDCVRKIHETFGVNQYAVIVSDGEHVSQQWCDSFLPAWAWLQKYQDKR